MSFSLKAIALYQLELDEINGDYNVLTKNERIGPSAVYETVMAEIHSTFRSKTPNFAKFIDGSEMHERVSSYQEGNDKFFSLSSAILERALPLMESYQTFEEVTLIVAHYETLATEVVAFAMMPSTTASKFNANLDIESTDYFDTSKVPLMASIDLSTLVSDVDSTRYISVTKGAKPLKNFALDLLDAEAGFEPKHENQVLMQAVDDFVADLDKEEALSLRKSVQEYAKSTDEIDINELSSELPSFNGDGSFADYVENEGYELADTFPTDNTVLKHLTKFVGSGGGINITFDAALMGERVFYDAETDQILIKGTPPNLRDSLTRRAVSTPFKVDIKKAS